MSIFKNPMVLMMIVSAGILVVMPKMMEGLDPEQKEQMQKQMAMQQDPSKVRLFSIAASLVLVRNIMFHLTGENSPKNNIANIRCSRNCSKI